MEWVAAGLAGSLAIAVSWWLSRHQRAQDFEEKERTNAAAWYEKWEESEARYREQLERNRVLTDRNHTLQAEAAAAIQEEREQLFKEMFDREQRWENKCTALASRIERLEQTLMSHGLSIPNGEEEET